MGTWSDIANEISATNKPGGKPDYDGVRRKYLAALKKHTKRNVILYASRWVQGGVPSVPQSVYQITDSDLQGFMETIYGLKGKHLDLILHSPGGDPNATEGIVTYLRSKFNDIRVVVPQFAFSAATMMACAADKIVMGRHSYLGPTDPQMTDGSVSFPAQAALDQFEMALKDCRETKNIGAWAPILPKYGPSMLVQCKNAVALSTELVEGWLQRYMLKDDPKKDVKAERIAKWFSDHGRFKTHGRHIGRSQLRARGLVIENLEDDPVLQDLVLSIYHATTHVFMANPGVIKIIENHQGRALITTMGVISRGGGKPTEASENEDAD